MSLILARSHYISMEIDHCHSPPSADSRRVIVSYKLKYMHKLNCIVKFAQKEGGEVNLSSRLDQKSHQDDVHRTKKNCCMGYQKEAGQKKFC